MNGNSISRRDFIKLMGFGAATIGLGAFVKIGSLNELNKLIPRSASAQSVGSWSLGQPTLVVAIHAALLPSGKIFYLAGSGYHVGHENGPFESAVVEPPFDSGSQQTLATQNVDLFCAGLAGLPNGNVLVAGGTKIYDTDISNCNGFWHGLEAAFEVNGSTGVASPVASMAHGRWYPTCITLADGKVLVVNGYDEYGIYNLLAEIYDPSSGSWSQSYDPNSDITYTVGASQEAACPGAGSPTYGGPGNGVAPNVGVYPKMHLMPSGLVITCGPTATVRSWDPATGIWNIITQTSSYRDYGTSFLLPLNNTATERGKIMIVGGDRIATEPALSTVEILDFNAGSSTNPVVRTTASIQHARKFLLPVILPNGKCTIFAGFAPDQGGESGNYTNIPEMFDPVTETWSDLPAATVTRGYHGIALLLPDGRVWTASDTPSKTDFELRTEIFTPDYALNPQARPTISGTPIVGNYGGTITIPTPEAPNITKVSLVRLMACTHHYDPNARLLWLQIQNSTANSVTVLAPVNSRLAPPGYYMIHVLNSAGIPSVSKIIQIPGTDSGSGDITPPTQVMDLTVTPVSSSQLNLAWTANAEPDVNHYNVYRGSSTGFVVTPGTTVPNFTPITNSFSNIGLSASTTYYYRVAAVDNTGNIGPLSAEQSGTTQIAQSYSILFDGVDDLINCSNDSTLWSQALTKFSFSFWIYLTSINLTNRTLVQHGYPSNQSFLCHRDNGNGEVIWFRIRNPSGTDVLAGIASSPSLLNRWAHITCVYDNSLGSANLKIYEDGVVGGTTGNLTQAINLSAALTLNGAIAGFQAGKIKDFRWWTTKALTNAEINDVRANLPSAPTPNYWLKMDEGSGNPVDSISGTKVGTLVGGASWSTEGSGSGDTTPPAQVAGLTVTPVSSSQLNLAWTANTEPDLNHYNVYTGTSTGFAVTPGTTVPTGTPTTNSFSNLGLGSSTTYYYRVAAVDNAGNIGSLSTEGSGTTQPPPDVTPPAIVLGLTVTPVSSSQLNLAWTANTEPDLNHYNVYRGTSTGFVVTPGTTVPTFTPITNSISNTGLSQSTTYYYRVAAVDNSGNIGPLSAEQSGTTNGGADTTPPAIVLGLTVTPVSSSQLNLAWTANTEPDLNHYNVYRGTSTGFVVTPGTTVPTSTPNGNAFSNNGLSPSTTYYYRVAAVDNTGNIGPLSAEQSGTTQIAQSYSILFDGVDDLINCSNDSTLWSRSLTKFSFSFWMNVSSINLTNRTLVQHGYPSNQSFLCHRDNGNGNVVWFRIRNTSGTDILAGIASSPSLLNRWAHITCVYDNSLGSANLKIYEDGILGATTGNLTQAINLSAALTLNGAIAGFQAGKIKDFRWWTTKALTNAEINDVRANLPSAPTPNYWLKMDEGSGNPVDSISGTKVGTLVGGASWST